MVKRLKVYLFLKIFIAICIALFIGGGMYAYNTYKDIYKPNIFVKKNKTEDYLYIPTGIKKDSIIKLLNAEFLVRDTASLSWVMERKNYQNHIHPGKYLIRDKMSNNALVDMLRSGKQEPIKYVIKLHRSINNVSYKAATELEADYGDLILLFNDDEFLDSLGLTRESALGIIIPNTYYLNWNTSAREFILRMHSEYTKFWNKQRTEKAQKLGLTPMEVVILASIVERECKWTDEMPRVAGVYLNRLKRNIKLQADPTVIYAVGDFEIRRVLKKHIETDSPYNTYKYKGLPPGPICTPSITTIEHVLNAEKHKYMYFCASDDFSGYHLFAKNHLEHIINAKKFQRALNKKKIYK